MAWFNLGKGKQLEAELAAAREENASIRDQLTQVQNSSVNWGGISWDEFFSAASSSGVTVNADSAKRSAAVYACVRLIAGAISLLPFRIYQRVEGAREEVPNHDIYWLLNEQPFSVLSSATFWEWVVSCMLYRGDAIAEIIRDRNGNVKNFMPIPRECWMNERVGNSLRYYIDDGISRYGREQHDILHFPCFGLQLYGQNGARGVYSESVIAHAAKQAVGTALAADQYSGEFFANGATPSVVIQYPQGVAPTDAQQDKLRQSFDEKHTGLGKRHKPLLLVNGGEIQTVSLSAQDAQLLETRKYQVLDIARAFGVPPHMIGETTAATSWGSGIEQLSIAFVRYTLGPHLRRIEQELNRKLWPRSLKYFVEADREGLLSGDSKAEAEFFAKALGGPGSQGYMSVDEIRHRKNLPPKGGWCGEIVKAGAKPNSSQQDLQNEPDTAAPKEPGEAA